MIPASRNSFAVPPVETISIPLAAGERDRTIWEFIPYLQNRCLDILQPDCCHTGGKPPAPDRDNNAVDFRKLFQDFKSQCALAQYHQRIVVWRDKGKLLRVLCKL